MKFARHHFSPVVALTFGLAALHAQPSPQPPVPDELDLKTAIGFALENNFAIRQAREHIKQQEGVLVELKARSIPNAAVTSSYGRVDPGLVPSPIPGFPVNTQAWSIALNVTQTLFAGGGVRSAVKSSELSREAALLALEGTINDALLQVRTAFYNVLLSREKVVVQEKNLQLLQEQLKTTTDRFEAGTVSSFEKLRAEVAVANAKVPLITARNDHRLAIDALRQALGFTTNDRASLNKVPEFVGSLAYTPVTFELASALEAAHAHRPDLLRLARLATAREQDVRTQKSTYYPTLGVSGGYQYKNNPYIRGARFNTEIDGWTLGVQSSWAIFDGRATAGRVAQARSALEQARLALAEAKLNADVEVRRAFSSWQEATELADASKKVTEQAEEAVRLANARYSAGTGTQLDVLSAQVDLTTARTNELQAYYNYDVAVASLRRATGQADEFVK